MCDHPSTPLPNSRTHLTVHLSIHSQSHPARDAHDTFFVKEPASALTVPEDYYERVKAVHQDGGYGSIGYGWCVSTLHLL